jgi:2'-5' RNA ligase
MSCPTGAGRTLSQFALVSYIAEPLAGFLDRLRLDIAPECKPHAHVTALPPRPLNCAIRDAVEQLLEETRLFPPFEVELGEVRMFPVSNVVYIGLARGDREIRELHARLNTGELRYKCNFDFHPHITIAQDLEKDCAIAAEQLSRQRWAEYQGTRRFTVDSLSFVQHVAPFVWLDIARIPLAVPVPAGR